MPRKPRILSSTGIYHITIRSVNQHIIFEEEADYQKCLLILLDCKQKYDIDIFAYCLMDNHLHFLLKSSLKNLSGFFQSFGSRFVRWYNKKYIRTGHLFQERYYSTPIENDAAYLAAISYIHNNPVKANICRYPSEYRWSSYNAFYGAKNPLINKSYTFDVAGSKDSLLRYFSADCETAKNNFYEKDHRKSKLFYTDEQALSIFKSVTGFTTTAEASNLPKMQRNQYILLLRQKGLTVKQVARFLDVSMTTVKRICQNEPLPPSPSLSL